MNDSCPVVWLVDTSPDAVRLADALERPAEHLCILPAAHIRGEDPRAHLCQCGARLEVRDVEPAATR